MSNQQGPMMEAQAGLEVASPRYLDKYPAPPTPATQSLLGNPQHHHQQQYGSPTSHPASTYTPSQQYATPLPPAFSLGGHEQLQNQHQQEYGKPGKSGGGGMPWGMRPWLFALLAALLGFVIGAAIVGGVLGSRVAELSSRPETTNTTTSQAPTTTITTTTRPTQTATADANNFAPALRPSQVNRLALDCPGVDRTTHSSFDGKRFSLECNVDNLGKGREVAGTSIADLATVYAYSYQDCLDACASYNRMGSRFAGRPSSMACRSASFRTDMNGDFPTDDGGNCYLKNATRADGNNGLPTAGILTGQLL